MRVASLLVGSSLRSSWAPCCVDHCLTPSLLQFHATVQKSTQGVNRLLVLRQFGERTEVKYRAQFIFKNSKMKKKLPPIFANAIDGRTGELDSNKGDGAICCGYLAEEALIQLAGASLNYRDLVVDVKVFERKERAA